ncbi:hypothetical protein [Leptolyngbya sp. FACHB-711]|nr:hypothetical protein [Leptolyngbya sp. FACHB-711]MBD2024496.1 hypothetical protein [Leptolyngbya sp. FACHB-711]
MSIPVLFKRGHFQPAIILLNVRWYFSLGSPVPQSGKPAYPDLQRLPLG